MNRTRPYGHTTIHVVEGDLLQVQCVCRWHSRRVATPDDAHDEAAMHDVVCGMCIRFGREFLDICGCANCERRRDAERRQSHSNHDVQLAIHESSKEHQWPPPPHDTAATSTAS
ncbi:MAG: hypothetical protein JWL76_2118 [Thermoleophilia bacterium]|nr:hypothetical protein [Thermoleophilia bacterium]